MKIFRIKYRSIAHGDDAVIAESEEDAATLFSAQFKAEEQLVIESIVETEITEKYIGSEFKK